MILPWDPCQISGNSYYILWKTWKTQVNQQTTFQGIKTFDIEFDYQQHENITEPRLPLNVLM